MNANQIKNHLAQVFEQDYQGYDSFVKDVVDIIFPGDDTYEALPVPEDFLTDENRQRANASGILQIHKVGTVNAEEPIDLFDITLSDKKELQYNRVGIQQFIRSTLFPFTNAFMLFHNETTGGKDWRFSYAYKETTIKGMTSAKRYTYLFGKNHRARTASERFAKLADEEKSTQSLLNAFSVEALSKSFFDEYKGQYDIFCKFLFDHKNDPNFFGSEFMQWEDKFLRDYVKKMMGRITFIYFLQRKGWMNGNMEYMQKAFEHSPYQDNYLDAFLEPLFFGVLNTKPEDRKTLFEKEGWELALLDEWKDVPYLNGGLFERDEQDKPMSKFPAEMFKNLFDFYARYNFTIDENDPDDAEVGVDPEMLGHIFENLLEDNKDKGAFYTPKEIVQYMSQESIAQYLKTHTEEALHPAIDELIKEKKVNELLQNKAVASVVYSLLQEVKVCDPAIGSGAFPMGVLNVLYHARLLLYGFTKPTQEFSPSEVKREIIQNNIYGVDIEKGAIDIARLRFWLALVVDEIEPEPLPNLDFKIMQGNSLVEQFENLDLSDLLPKKNEDGLLLVFDEETQLQAILHEKQYRYFSTTNHEEKQTIRNEIVKVVKDLIIERTQGNTNIPEKLQTIDLSSNDQFFLWHTWFADVFEEGGFDVVIGNPPFLRIQGIRVSNPKLADYLSKNYVSATGSFDLYVTFVERGLGLIKQKGVVNYIMPTKWTNSAFGKGLRRLVSKTKSASMIINFGAYQVFNASTYTGLQWFSPNNDYLKYIELDRDLSSNVELKQYLDSLNDEHSTIINNEKLNESQWVLTNNAISEILNKLEQHPRRIKDVFEKIFQGLATSKDDVYFIYDSNVNDDFIIGESKQLGRKVQIEKGLVKPLLKGEDVHRYDTIKTDRYVVFPYKIQNGKAILYSEIELSEHFPRGYEYLKECEPVLREREKGRFNIDGEWFQFGRKQGILFAEKEKLVAPDISMGGNFAYDSKGEFYQTTTIYGYIKKQDVQENYKLWLALLNSRLCWWYMANTGTVLANGFFRYKPDYINPFPVPSFEFTSKVQDFIDQLVDFILYLKNDANPDVLSHTSNDRIISHIMEIVDMVIYELYFEQHMKDNQIDVISYLKSYPWSIKPIDISVKIEEFYYWYQQSDNPIRQHIMLLETRSKYLLYQIHSKSII